MKKILGVILCIMIFTSCTNTSSIDYEEHITLVRQLRMEIDYFKVEYEDISMQLEEVNDVNKDLNDEIERLEKELKYSSEMISELVSKDSYNTQIIEDLNSEISVYEDKELESRINRQEFWSNYEEELNDATTHQEIFSLYRSNLDGAYAMGYMSKLLSLVEDYGIVRFMEELSSSEQATHSGEICLLLFYQIDEFIYNGVDMDISSYADNIVDFIESEERTNSQLLIAYNLLTLFEHIDT